MTDAPAPQRILIVRLSALGDLVFATTLLHGLKRAYPQAEVDWLAQPEFADFLATQPAIAQVYRWDRKPWAALFKSGRWLALWRAVRALSGRLRARDYDLVVDAQGLLKSRALARLAGGRRRVGYASKEPGGLLLHETFARPRDNTPIASEHRALVKHLTGVEGAAPLLTAPPQASALLATPFIALAPFTTRPQKHWPEAHWAALIRQLVEHGHTPVLLGGPADADAAQRILAASGMPDGVHNLVGKTRIAEAAATIAASRALIGVDTGLTHMGIAFDRPTVAIFGSTVPYRGGARAPLAVLWLGMACSPCRRKPTCGGAFTCLADIAPSQVRAALDRVLTP